MPTLQLLLSDLFLIYSLMPPYDKLSDVICAIASRRVSGLLSQFEIIVRFSFALRNTVRTVLLHNL